MNINEDETGWDSHSVKSGTTWVGISDSDWDRTVPEDIDPVNAPPHYNTGNIECIDAIQESMSPEAFKGYCKGNALKYIWRASYKGKPIEDLHKAIWYIERLMETEFEPPTILKK